MPESIAKIKRKDCDSCESPQCEIFIRAQALWLSFISGSGIRIKILKAWLEKQFLGTSKAMEGIHLTEKVYCDTSEGIFALHRKNCI